MQKPQGGLLIIISVLSLLFLVRAMFAVNAEENQAGNNFQPLDNNIERISMTTSGTTTNDISDEPAISANGCWIAFTSSATDLAGAGTDTNDNQDVFLYHRCGSTTAFTRISQGVNGQPANGWSDISVISADGRFVIFRSYSTNLSPIPTNGQWQLYLHDRMMNLTEMVTVSTGGEASNEGGGYQSISADGRYVVFSTWADNLVPDDTNNKGDVFVRDRLNGITWRITTGSTGEQGNGNSYGSYISANGRYVVFTSFANNLVLNDTNNRADTFVHDLLTGETERANLTMTGQQSNEHGGAGNISADGRFVTFVSSDSNLVVSDTNNLHDVFVRDRALGFNERVNVSTATNLWES